MVFIFLTDVMSCVSNLCFAKANTSDAIKWSSSMLATVLKTSVLARIIILEPPKKALNYDFIFLENKLWR